MIPDWIFGLELLIVYNTIDVKCRKVTLSRTFFASTV